MQNLGSDDAAGLAGGRARTLLATAEAVFLWPGIPLTEKYEGFMVPMQQGWVRYWTARLHGAQTHDSAIDPALAQASKYLSWGFQAAAQSALDAARLDKVSPDGAQSMRVIAARLGITAPDMPVVTQALSWGIGSPGDFALYDLFADEAVKLEKAWFGKDWDESKHPRWPKDDPDNRGGRFSPKGSAQAHRILRQRRKSLHPLGSVIAADRRWTNHPIFRPRNRKSAEYGPRLSEASSNG